MKLEADCANNFKRWNSAVKSLDKEKVWAWHLKDSEVGTRHQKFMLQMKLKTRIRIASTKYKLLSQNTMNCVKRVFVLFISLQTKSGWSACFHKTLRLPWKQRVADKMATIKILGGGGYTLLLLPTHPGSQHGGYKWGIISQKRKRFF